MSDGEAWYAAPGTPRNSSGSYNGESPYYSDRPIYEHEVEWGYEQPLPSIKGPIKWVFSDFKRRTIHYFVSMFPFLQWIYRYNLTWLYGDVIAGITVGIVVVPQGMSYAKVAGLPVQYGLYSSFIGVMLYCFFATSKDVSIGPVAVMSAETYKITHKVLKDIPSLSEKDLPMIASSLSLLCGGITMGLGVLRLGFLLEYIPMPAVLGFMTGSAFTIAVGQVPSLFGINKLLNTRDASYLVVIHTLQKLHKSNVNAAFGLVSLFVLYALKFGCGYMEKRDRRRKWLWFYLNTLRAALVIIFTTLISWGCYRIYGPTKISMIKTVPRGLQNVGVHPVRSDVVTAFASELPIAVVVLLLEHIAIAKSFGRVNEYRINSNQELIAIGVANLIGHFFDAYPNTGSFSRTALKSKCGVRTPLAGILTGACVLVAIYALTDAFYYISNAALSAVIIHAVGDLVASYKATWKFFLVSPVECLIFFVDVILCVFVNLEAGIYFSFAASMVFLLLKQTFPIGEFMGKVEFTSHVASPPIEDNLEVKNLPPLLTEPVAAARAYRSKINNFVRKHRKHSSDNTVSAAASVEHVDATDKPGRKQDHEEIRSVDESNVSSQQNSFRFGLPDNVPLPTNLPVEPDGGSIEVLEEAVMPDGFAEPKQQYTKPVVLNPGSVRTKWWPLSHDNIHPGIRVVPPPPGILVYRFRESLTYQNVAWQTDRIVEYVRKHTRRNMDAQQMQNIKLGDRPWNDNGPRHPKPSKVEDTRPVLRAIVFDMSCSPNVDLTGAQTLWDCQQEVTKYACGPVEFHFAGILSEWSRRALYHCGFGGNAKTLPPQTNRLVEIAEKRAEDPPPNPVKVEQTESVEETKDEESTETNVFVRYWRHALVKCGLGNKRRKQAPSPQVLQPDESGQISQHQQVDAEAAELDAQYNQEYNEESNLRDPEQGLPQGPRHFPVVDTNNCYFHFDIPDLV